MRSSAASLADALGVQTAARFDALENKVDTGFAERRTKFDRTAAAHEQSVRLLDHAIARLDDE